MSVDSGGPLKLTTNIESWPLSKPLKISGYTFEFADIVLVTLERDGCVGRGEASGVYYHGETAKSIVAQLEHHRVAIELGVSRQALLGILPPGGARNAVDCALWDLEAKLFRRPAWKIAELTQPHPLLTTFTCSADTPEIMAEAARRYEQARAIKLKLTGDSLDLERVRQVRFARPDVWLGVDCNQSYTRPSLERILPDLVELGIELIEQPLPFDQDFMLDGLSLRSPIPIAADESAQKLDDLARLVGRFNAVNIKLDKCGGLTEAMAMARAARLLGLKTMVGSMVGTSLAIGPAFLAGQLCDIVDLDAPIFLRADRQICVEYLNGTVNCPESLWGNARP